MTYITRKERQTNSSLFENTLSLKSEKYRSAKNECVSATTMIVCKASKMIFFFFYA